MKYICNMKFKNICQIFSLVICMLVLSSFQLSSSSMKKVKKEIKSAFDISNFKMEPFSIENSESYKLLSKFTTKNFYTIKNESSELMGYAYMEKAPSKTAEFDYLILLDNDLVVKKTKVLIYREEYGGEIASKRWLKQFTGKTINDGLIYKKDIAVISGATISVRSLTNAVNNFMKSVAVLHEKNIL